MTAREELEGILNEREFTTLGTIVATAALAVVDALDQRPDPVAAFLDKLRLVESALRSRIDIRRIGDLWIAATADGQSEGQAETPVGALANLARLAPPPPEEA